MSLKAMAAVWEDSQARGNNRLVLLAIADIAGEDGTGCYLRQDKIAAKAGISVRTLQRCISELLEADELRVDRSNTRTTNDYTIVVALRRSHADDSTSGRRVEGRKQDTRQSDVSEDAGLKFDREVGGNDAISSPNQVTAAKLAGVESGAADRGSDATHVNLTRQVGGGEKATAANVGGSDTPPVGGSDPLLIRSLSAHATDDKLTSVVIPPQGSLIGRGESGKWQRQMDRQHANCHPEVCRWRNPKIRECMPMALVPRYAQKLPGLTDAAAIASVIEWAAHDAPPADYVAPGDVYDHWRIRWDLTRAKATGARLAGKGVVPERSSVPSASDTDALIREITAGRAS